MIGTAIVGAGTISKQHATAYLRFHDRCELKMVCDVDLSKAKALQAELGNPKVEAVSDLDEVLRRKDIQLISICTPPFTHEQLAVQCLEAGKDVLVEKPMAASLEECDHMMAVQKATGRYLGVVSQNRYGAANWKLKRFLDSGMAGRVLFGQVESFWYRGKAYYDVDWRGTWEMEGGGCTLNHAVHQIDLLNWMIGVPRTVTAVMGNVAHENSRMEDVSAAVLTYDQGAVVTLTASLVTHEEGQRLTFQCEQAGVSAPWQITCSASGLGGFPVTDEERKKALTKSCDSIPDPVYQGHEGQIDNLLRCLEAGVKPSEQSIDGRAAVEVITAMYQSAFTKRTVTLPLSKESLYYTKESFLKNVKDFQWKG